EGSPEERACFGLFSIRAGAALLTEGFDSYTNGYRAGPLVSGYHAAEWLVWNWWRLCAEPRTSAPNWWRAHQMNAIGEGYVWPNVTVFSDGVRTTLLSEKSAEPDAKPFRYFGSLPTIVPTGHFEAAVESFVPQVLARLRDASIPEGCNLDRLWEDLVSERQNPERTRFRRLEALLGRDPDEVEDDLIENLIGRSKQFGPKAIEELAAHCAQRSADESDSLADGLFNMVIEASGTDAAPDDAIRFATGTKRPRGADVPAWRIGTAAAKAIREQTNLGCAPLSNVRLAEMAGTSAKALDAPLVLSDLSFVYDKGPLSARIVLRSRWATSRRFDLARLIGDRLLYGSGEALHPATRASTYRQKAQRAFAVELLAPFDAVDEMIHADYSTERQQAVAEHFEISPWAVNRALKNHGRIDSDFYDDDFEAAVA
ncbi:MAG: hypothetical protein RIC82_01150, partial [Parvibaculum sp.]